MPARMRWAHIVGIMIPCWSAVAGFCGAADVAQSSACELRLQSNWVCFGHLGAPDYEKDNRKYIIIRLYMTLTHSKLLA